MNDRIIIISGGQTGVDQAALRAAKAAGLRTGGLAPMGWQTEDGPAPWLEGFGLLQCNRAGYPARTRANVDNAHATLILADATDHTCLRGGTRLTFDLAYKAGRRGSGLFLADLRRPEMVAECAAWVRECRGCREGFLLNVAGPREGGLPGIGARAEAWLTDLFTTVKGAAP